MGFSRLLTAGLFAAVLAGPAGMPAAVATPFEDYKNATTAEELIRAEVASAWKNQGADPEDQPRYFDCWVQIYVSTHTPEELETIDRFAKDRSQQNGTAQLKAKLARKGRVDVVQAVEDACDRYVGK